MGRPPWRLPGYRVEQLLGVGGYGEVWQGRVRSTGAAVALKRIPLTDPGQRQAALAEAAFLAGLDHPHLVRLHRVVPIDGALVLVLDLAAGGTLARLLAARGRLSAGETITALAPIAAALAQAHSGGVVHGDVTTANVLFSQSGFPLLADLGVARLFGDRAPARMTPEYADPTVHGGYLPTPATDVFMLGAVAVHTLTGQLPWEATAPAEPAAADLWRAAVAGRLGAGGVPDEMSAVVLRSLALEPERRGTAADFALDLRHSGHPVAVELSAGRSRIEPSLARLAAIAAQRPLAARHPAANRRPDAGLPTGALRSSAQAPAPLGAPVLAIAGSCASSPRIPKVDALIGPGDAATTSDPPFRGSAVPFTQGARLPSPLVPRERRHGAPGGSIRFSTSIAALAIALGLVVVALAWWPVWTRWAGPSESGPLRVAAAQLPASVTTFSSRTPSSSRSGGPGPPPPAGGRRTAQLQTHDSSLPLSPGAVGLVLRRLDARRAAAFARGNAGLLRLVYSSPVLQRRDAALLKRAVPAGCGLRGVRTSFTDIHIAGRHGTDVVLVSARAVLAPSRLVCGETTVTTAPGTGLSVLRIRLQRTSSGMRIASQRVVD